MTGLNQGVAQQGQTLALGQSLRGTDFGRLCQLARPAKGLRLEPHGRRPTAAAVRDVLALGVSLDAQVLVGGVNEALAAYDVHVLRREAARGVQHNDLDGVHAVGCQERGINIAEERGQEVAEGFGHPLEVANDEHQRTTRARNQFPAPRLLDFVHHALRDALKEPLVA